MAKLNLAERARTWWPLAVLIAATVLIALIGNGSESLSSFAAGTLINIILVVGLYVFTGNSGVLNFGHISFMAVGAYVCAFLTIPALAKGLLLPELPDWLRHSEMSTTSGVLVAAGVATVLGAIVSIPLMRLAGLRAAIATLALLIIVGNVLTGWVAGGSGSVTRVPVDTTPGSAAVWVILCLCLAFAFQRSRWGMRLRATREDEIAARALGIGVTWERCLAFTLGAFMLGVGGALYGHFVGSFSPSVFFLQFTFLTIAMLIVGGMTSLTGAFTGAVLLSALTEVFRRLESDESVLFLQMKIPAGYREIAIALVMLLVLIRRPSGLTRGREVPLPRLPRLARAGRAPAVPPTVSETEAS
jgi:branched-chain amino acid transport system permease protein